MTVRFFIIALLGLWSLQAKAEAYLVADRVDPENLRILGISGLSPEGCDSGSVTCSNFVLYGQIDRIQYEESGYPSLLMVSDLRANRRYSIPFPYDTVWNEIGTADAGWVPTWLKEGDQVMIIGTIGGSSAAVSMDSIYLLSFLATLD